MKNQQSQEVLRFFNGVKKRRKKVLIITDENVLSFYNTLLKKTSFPVYVIPPGEASKSRKRKEQIEDYLFLHGYNRETELVAFGGGVVSDLTGFVAATFMRGVTFSIVPTTVTGLCDASVGGKTGINTSFGKNLVGAFYSPVDCCTSDMFLETLPRNEYKEQFAEVVKMALILDRELFMTMEGAIFRARALKETIVQEDAKEKGIRKILNFGHTFAHAYEKVSEYKISHGKAVWLGMYFASFLSRKLGILPEREFALIEAFYKKMRVDLAFELDEKEVVSAMMYDKKNSEKTPCFILLSSIGSVYKKQSTIAHPVSTRVVLDVLYELAREKKCFVR